MSVKYSSMDNIHLTKVDKQKCFVNEIDGKVFIDPIIADIWEYAQGKLLDEVIAYYSNNLQKNLVQATLACLSEAHLLKRDQNNEPNEGNTQSEQVAKEDGLLSVIIVAYDGIHWLKELLPSIYCQTYTPVEIIIVDNASPSLDMANWIKNNHPAVQLNRVDKAMSFAAANNLGISKSHGKYLLLLNQDTKLEKNALSILVETANQDTQCAVVATKLRFLWAPQFINGMGNIVRKYSWGADIGFGNLDIGQFDVVEYLPSACFAGALILRAAWDVIGKIDEGFPMYYEDSEWCYRARLLGFNIKAAPNAIIYHAFGGQVPSGEKLELTAKKLENACYGRLRFAQKLFDEGTRDDLLSNYSDEDVHNFFAHLGHGRINHALAIIRGHLRFRKTRKQIDQLHLQLATKSVIQSATLLESVFDEPPVFEHNGVPKLTMDSIKNYYLPLIVNGRTNITMPEFNPNSFQPDILIVSNDIVASKMAGTGMRYLEIARALSECADVTLAVPGKSDLDETAVKIVSYDEDYQESLQILVDNHQQSLISGYMALKFPFLEKTRTKLIVDLYDPFFLENYYYYTNLPIEEQEKHNRVAIQVVNRLAKMGDFFICGNERQRDLYLGVLSANGRINPRNLSEDDSLRHLIDIVGIGFPSRAPVSRGYLRGAHPAFSGDEKIVLWGGGIWNWLDPITLVKAWQKVIASYQNARLVFLGTRHPNPKVPQHEIVEKVINEAEQIGEKEQSIFFIEWLDYEERESILLESDVGITLHAIHAETRYSIRSRVMDYFWAGLPVVITEGDITSEWVRSKNLGIIVPPNNIDATANAIIDLLNRDKNDFKEQFDNLREEMNWQKVVEPLRNYILHGKNAPDRQDFYRSMREDPLPEPDEALIKNPLKKAMFLWATKGFRAMLKQTIIHIKFLLSKS